MNIISINNASLSNVKNNPVCAQCHIEKRVSDRSGAECGREKRGEFLWDFVKNEGCYERSVSSQRGSNQRKSELSCFIDCLLGKGARGVTVGFR